MGDYMSEIENSKEFKSNTLGENIKYIRKKANYTQEEFSEKLGITPQFLSSVERGIAGISINTAIKICQITECSPMLLFKDIIKVNSIDDKYDLLNEKDKSVINKMIEYLLENK